MSTRGALACTLACVALWGLVFVGVYKVLPELDPPQMVTLRFIGVSLFFGALLALRPDWRPRLQRREWAIVAGGGVMAVAGSQLPIVEGQRYLSPAIASLIVTFAPAVAAVLAGVFLRDRLAPLQWLGFALALAGVVLVVVLGSGSGAQLEASDPLRASVALLTPVAWALYTLASKHLSGHPPVGVVGVMLIVGTVCLVPIVPHAVDGAAHLSGGGWLWLAFLTLGGTAIPYILWSMSLRVLPVSRTAAFMYLVPVFALVWTLLIIGTVPPLVALVGGVVVLAGVALTQLNRPVPVPSPG